MRQSDANDPTVPSAASVTVQHDGTAQHVLLLGAARRTFGQYDAGSEIAPFHPVSESLLVVRACLA